nr:phage tail sheath subtilisin-like domain-containing protein [Methylogaea oryzae]
MHGAGKSPTPPWIWAAAYMAEAGHSLGIDPARQLRGRVLQVAAPAKSDRWDNTQRNELLYDGIATSTVDADGTVRIEAEISMYQTNAGGLGDDAWLFINRPETLERIRLEQRHYFTQRYPDWKLADDDYDVPPGQPIMQPKKAVAELIFLYRTVFMPRGWCQDLEGYKQTLLAAVHPTNRDRLDVYDSPKLINNMRLLAAHTEFR